MSKGLKALDELFAVYFDNDVVKEKHGIVEKTAKEKHDAIEKELKAFEIIKESICDISVDYWEHLDRYTISLNHYSRDITKEEYELLKEVLS